MIRVGFIFAGDGNLGVSNYYGNLLRAVLSLPDRRIEPVIITGQHSNLQVFREFPTLEVLRTKLADRKTFAWASRKVSLKLGLSDIPLQKFLIRHRIAALSHSDYLGRRSSVPAICWIGDFQHKHLPEFFTAEEAQARDRSFGNICRFSSRVVVSSLDALADLRKFHPDCVAGSSVLQFVADLQDLRQFPTLNELQGRYGFSGEYFHLPNQFWAHKNHQVIIAALKILKSQGRHVQILATGTTNDYRQPGYFTSILKQAEEIGLTEDYFRILGVVPYTDLVGLMRHSVAVINPSLFEGWSSTVEEAKSLGKAIILSNIPVHLEQAPRRATFFDPKDAEILSRTLWETLSSHNSVELEQKHIEVALAELTSRKQGFGRKYQELVLDVLNGVVI